ncbi:unnamed protein product [Tuber aestivum]|uniref:Uncharacterized protein n=1 Tax=Tuber aestivum TaxID=59557 RepID=A0A292PL85_9PEZI|nr:unnamed protein product [Tuber aestivum]
MYQYKYLEPDFLGGGAEENSNSGDILFYQKGVNTVVFSIIQGKDWLNNQCGDMVPEGLRIMVVGRKNLSIHHYRGSPAKHEAAGKEMGKALEEYIEHDLKPSGARCFVDRLRKDVKPSLNALRNAGTKIWMLTGDKVGKERCVAVSAKLVSGEKYVHTIAKLKRKNYPCDSLEFLRNKTNPRLLIDDEPIALFLDTYNSEFISLAVQPLSWKREDEPLAQQ